MRRVSSRQRIVSWDAFEAATNEGESSDSDVSESDVRPVPGNVRMLDLVLNTKSKVSPAAAAMTVSSVAMPRSAEQCQPISLTEELVQPSPTSLPTSLQNRRRKRGRSSKAVTNTIPSFSREQYSHQGSQRLTFDGLLIDLHLAVMEFLDVASLRVIMAVNHQFRELLLSQEAITAVWKPHYTKVWPMMKGFTIGQDATFVDSYQLPVAASTDHHHHHTVNIPLLLGMTPSALPTNVDEVLILSRSQQRSVRVSRSSRSQTGSLLRAYRSSQLELCKAGIHEGEAKPTVVRYTGHIGVGDRCVRANSPLPRPILKSIVWKSPLSLLDNHAAMAALYPPNPDFIGRPRTRLYDLICLGARAVSRHGMVGWRPFVSPYMERNGDWQVTPRMIAYYEVDILEKADSISLSESSLPFSNSIRPGSNTECVAVGLATKNFSVHSRMPGWDSKSFGYHGDDGGIFHSSGGMVEQFGPKFGSGDTVGCGIDYVARGIFFTLNGEFLGYGWKNVNTEILLSGLYPVVGIDTHAPISLNFGNLKPFKFDLTEFHKKHETVIASQYKFKVSSPVHD